MKLKINKLKAKQFKDYENVIFRNQSSNYNLYIFSELDINGVVVGSKLFEILDIAFRNCKPVKIKADWDNFNLKMKMHVTAIDICCLEDAPLANFNLSNGK